MVPVVTTGSVSFSVVASQDRPEVEWQLEAVDLRPVERWLSSRGPDEVPSLTPLPTVSLVDTYLDTSDWRLHRAGYSLRVREQNGDGGEAEATLKSLGGNRDGPRVRREITESIPKADPAALERRRGPVSERIRSLAARGHLHPLLEVRTTRRRLAVMVEDSKVGELTLDRTTIPVEGEDVPVVLQRVEIESAGAETDERLDALAGSLRDTFGLVPAVRSKFESGLLARGLAPPEPPDLGPTRVTPALTTGELAFASLRVQLAEVLAHEPGARLGEDPEEVHDMRVATRRMRAGIALFQSALPARARWLRKELGWIARSLGAVRDLDVQIEQLTEWTDAAEGTDRKALEPLVRILDKRRRQARRKLIRDLDSRRYARLVQRGTELLRNGPLSRSTAARMPIVSVAQSLLSKPYKRVRKEGDAIQASSEPAAFHSLRIRCKRLRYALEFLSPLAPKESRAFVKRLVDVQDVLGEHQDAQVAMAHIRELVSDDGPSLEPRTVFALGRVVERYDHRAAELRDRFPRVYRELRGREWKDIQHALERRRLERAAAPRRPAAAVARPPAPSSAEA
jgi:CHAD domain-containing protein